MEKLMDGQVVLEKASATLPQCWPHSPHLHVGLGGVRRVRFALGEL